jgi:hypothetical protein
MADYTTSDPEEAAALRDVPNLREVSGAKGKFAFDLTGGANTVSTVVNGVEVSISKKKED